MNSKHSLVPLSEKNVSLVAEMHLKAFKGHLNVLLGQRYIKVFLKWFYMHSNTVHHVVEGKNGQVLGYVVGAPWGYQKEINRYLLKPGVLAILSHPWVIFNKRVLRTISLRIKTLLGRNKHIHETALKYPKPMISLVGIAVSTKARGRNIGKLLIDSFEKSALENGYSTMRLSVYQSNHRARKFYEKNGWNEEPSKSNNHVLGYYKPIKSKFF